MSSEATKSHAPRPPPSQRSRPPPAITIKPIKSKVTSKRLFYSLAGIASLFVVGGLCYFGYELTKPTKKPSTKKSGLTNTGRVNKTKQSRPKGDYYDIVVKRGAGQAIGIMLCPGENKTPGAFVAACKANIDLGLKIGSQLVEVNGKWLDSDMNFKETAQLLAKSCSPEGKLCFRKMPELNAKWIRADKMKTEGNELYKKKQVDASISKYSDAIKLHPTNKVYYSNKVLALLSKAEHCTGETTPIYYEALSDCRAMRELDVFENYQKGHHVRGVVLLRMGKFKHARTAFQTVLRIDPKNKKALARLKDCQNAIANAAAEAELKKKESRRESVPEEKQQAFSTEEKAVIFGETAEAIKQPEKPKGNEVPVAPSKVDRPEKDAEDIEIIKKPDSPNLTQMVEDLKEEVKEMVKIPEKFKEDTISSEDGTRLSEDAGKDGLTKKELVSTTLSQLVEDLKEEVSLEQETIIPKPEQKNAEEAPSEITAKPEEAKDKIVEEVRDEESVHQNETHSSAPLKEAKADHPAKPAEGPNASETVTEKMNIEPSKKIVEDMVKTTVKRAVGQVIESGGEIIASQGESEQPANAAVAGTTDESLDNSAAITTTKQKNLVDGVINNNTLV